MQGTWTVEQASDAAGFLATEGWLPPHYAVRLARWLYTAHPPKNFNNATVAIRDLDFPSVRKSGKAKSLAAWIDNGAEPEFEVTR